MDRQEAESHATTAAEDAAAANVWCEEVDAAQLLSEAAPYLQQHQLANNVILGYAAMNPSGHPAPTTFYMVKHTNGSLCGAAMHTEGHAVLLAVPASPVAVRALEEHLQTHQLPKGVNGPDAAAELFACLRSSRGLHPPWCLSVSLVLYELQGAAALAPTAQRHDERLRVLAGSEEDVSLVTGLAQMFAAELRLDDNSATVGRRLRTLGTGANMMVLEGHEGDVKCLVTSARETEDYAVINNVFTLPASRRQGCATRAIHRACTEVLLRRKKGVALFADADDLGPNLLYQSLGFCRKGTTQGWAPEGVRL